MLRHCVFGFQTLQVKAQRLCERMSWILLFNSLLAFQEIQNYNELYIGRQTIRSQTSDFVNQ